MKRFSDMAAEIGRTAERRAKPAAQPAAPRIETDVEPVAQHAWSCTAYGCPLAGSISSSLVGGGPWYCRFHFGRMPTDFDEITTRIKHGNLLDLDEKARTKPSQSVVEMWSRMHRPPARAAAYLSVSEERQPGEDEE